MKTKFIVLLAISALITLSFTFVSVSNTSSANPDQSANVQNVGNQPVGGLVYESK